MLNSGRILDKQANQLQILFVFPKLSIWYDLVVAVFVRPA